MNESRQPAVTPASFGVWHPAKEQGMVLDAFGSPGSGFVLRVAQVDRRGGRVERIEQFDSQDELVDRWNSLMSQILQSGYHDSLLVPPSKGLIFVPRSQLPN